MMMTTIGTAPPEIVNTASVYSSGAANPRTIAGVNLGSYVQGRISLIGVSYAAANAGVTVTVGGVGTTMVPGTQLSATGVATQRMEFHQIVTTGTSASFVITNTGAMTNVEIGVWAIYNARSSTPVAVAIDPAQPLSLNVNVTGPGVAAGMSLQFINSGSITSTWTGMTKIFELVTTGVNRTVSGAQYAGIGSSTPLVVTATAPAVTMLGAAVSYS